MPPRYEIRLRAPRGAECDGWFVDLDRRRDGPVLLLRGELDQAALHGLLERVRLLRLDVVDVRRTRSAPHRRS